MANPEHVAIAKQGAEVLNRWREGNFDVKLDLSGADLSNINFSEALFLSADLYRTNLSEANLVKANLSEAHLREANLTEADLQETDLSEANLSEANLSHANLKSARLNDADLSKANLSEANLKYAELNRAKFGEAHLINTDLSSARLSDAFFVSAHLINTNLHDTSLFNANFNYAYLFKPKLSEAVLEGASLRHAHLISADLHKANLHEAILSHADLSSANLSFANLSITQVLGTNLEKAIFTGACIEDWHINSETKLKGAICEHIFLKLGEISGYTERRPSHGDFTPGDFTKLVRQSINTVDLIFRNGINWEAFTHSFKRLQVQTGSDELDIQAIENKGDGDFVIRVNSPPGADKAKIQEFVMEEYGKELKTLEVQYEKQLRLQGEQHTEEIKRIIAAERQEKAKLMEVLAIMANNQGSTFDLRGAKFAGGFAETVQGAQIGGTQDNHDDSEEQD